MKKFRKMDQQAEGHKKKTETVTGLGRRKKRGTKWNQMTALRFQTGKKHQTSPASRLGAETERGRDLRRKRETAMGEMRLKTIRDRPRKKRIERGEREHHSYELKGGGVERNGEGDRKRDFG